LSSALSIKDGTKTLSITTFSIKGLYMTFSVNDTQA